MGILLLGLEIVATAVYAVTLALLWVLLIWQAVEWVKPVLHRWIRRRLGGTGEPPV